MLAGLEMKSHSPWALRVADERSVIILLYSPCIFFLHLDYNMLWRHSLVIVFVRVILYEWLFLSLGLDIFCYNFIEDIFCAFGVYFSNL